MTNIVILGATSAMAQAVARLWAGPKTRFLLAGRRSAELHEVALDLGAREAKTTELVVDFNAADAGARIKQACADFGQIDILLFAAGTNLPNEVTLSDPQKAQLEIASNYTAPLTILLGLVPQFVKQASGQIAVISSVAGDRGRKSNFIYGSAKAGISAFTDGLRAYLKPRGVAVTLIKPGIVQSPMTKALNVTGPFMVHPDVAGRAIAKAVAAKAPVVYAPGLWRLIMLVIRHIPIRIFDRLNF